MTSTQAEQELSLAERVRRNRKIIAAGPWEFRTAVQGPRLYIQQCEVCEQHISGMYGCFVRLGDDLSPALYRHNQCHEDSVKFTGDIR